MTLKLLEHLCIKKTAFERNNYHLNGTQVMPWQVLNPKLSRRFQENYKNKQVLFLSMSDELNLKLSEFSNIFLNFKSNPPQLNMFYNATINGQVLKPAHEPSFENILNFLL